MVKLHVPHDEFAVTEATHLPRHFSSLEKSNFIAALITSFVTTEITEYFLFSGLSTTPALALIVL
jgi:transcription termination factor NusB